MPDALAGVPFSSSLYRPETATLANLLAGTNPSARQNTWISYQLFVKNYIFILYFKLSRTPADTPTSRKDTSSLVNLLSSSAAASKTLIDRSQVAQGSVAGQLVQKVFNVGFHIWVDWYLITGSAPPLPPRSRREGARPRSFTELGSSPLRWRGEFWG